MKRFREHLFTKPIFHLTQKLKIGSNFQEFQQGAFRLVLDASLVIGGLAGAVYLITNLLKGDWFYIALFMVVYLGLVFIRWGIKERAYQWRAGLFVGLFFILGLVMSFIKGTVGDGRIWMLVGIILAALFLRIQAGFLLIGINMVCWFAIGLIYRWYPDLYPHQHQLELIAPENISLWLNTGVFLLGVSLGLMITISFLLSTLADTLQHSQSLNAKLQKELNQQNWLTRHLESSEERYRRLVNNSPNLIMELDREYRILAINPAMKKSLGYPPDNKLINTILPERFFAQRKNHIQHAFRENKTVRFVDQRENSYFDNILIPSEELGTVQIIAVDITRRMKTRLELLRHQQHLEEIITEKTRELNQEVQERMRMKESALSAQKLADLGMLTTGVAHELNSPLQSILTWSELLLRKLKAKDQISPVDEVCLTHLEQIKENVLRCSKIVRSLRYYAHTQPVDYKPVPLQEIIDETLVLMKHQLTRNQDINLSVQVQDHLPKLHCKRDQIIQLLINMISNAQDALNGEGNINISAGYDPQQETLWLEVADNGHGITEEIQDEIFKPFFTTKAVGEGTGLGLYIVAGIAEAHGGTIQFESTPGEGTTFTIHFPDQPPENTIPFPKVKGRYSDMV